MLVYRTSSLVIKAAYIAHNEGLAERGKRRKAIVDASACAGRGILVNGRGGGFVGIEYHNGDEVPQGWRVETWRSNGHTHLVPDKRTKVGKQLDADINEADRLPVPTGCYDGMPTEFIGDYTSRGSHWYTPTFCNLPQDIDHVYALWGMDGEPTDNWDVDHFAWEVVKLSEWYALQEEVERQMAQDNRERDAND
jgi:hypothetical protein